MPKRLFFAAVATATAIALLPLQPAMAQGGLLGHLKDKAREKVQKGVDQAEDGITDAAYDKTTHAFKCALTDAGCVKRAEAAGKPVSIVDAEGRPVSSADSAHAIATANGTATAAAAAPAAPSLNSVQTHSDFKQGERVLYQTDFANAIIGDFPRNIQLDHGNVETVSFNGTKLLRTTSSSRLIIPLKEVLPQRFTMEFDYSGAAGWSMSARFIDESNADDLVGGEVEFSISGEADIEPSHGASAGATFAGDHDSTGKLIHCQIMADSNYIKLYINGQRVAQSPNAPLGRSNRIFIDLTGSENSPAFFGNIRVGAGGRDMYGALTSEGRFTTHGILFATGSAAIAPASAATLAEIGQMLQQHSDLKLEIDGHTDNVGSATSNQTLSEKRAASVLQYLVSNFHIDPSRLASKGFGASRPVASNATDDGKQQNRRVELVKM